MQGWLTLDSIPDRANFCISLPDAEEWRAQFLGGILALTKTENWEEFGALSALEMSDEWRAVLLDFMNGGCSMIPVASVLPFAGTLAPEGFLMCHGQSVLREDYPLLYNAIGLIYPPYIDDEHFSLPDPRLRVLAGANDTYIASWEIGDNGGEMSHTLTIGEIPSHTHRTKTAAQPLSNGPPYDTLPVGQGGVVQDLGNIESTGGGGAHNNMPPYLALNFIIKF